MESGRCEMASKKPTFEQYRELEYDKILETLNNLWIAEEPGDKARLIAKLVSNRLSVPGYIYYFVEVIDILPVSKIIKVVFPEDYPEDKEEAMAAVEALLESLGIKGFTLQAVQEKNLAYWEDTDLASQPETGRKPSLTDRIVEWHSMRKKEVAA